MQNYDQATIEKYQSEKQQCEQAIQAANNQLAVSNNQLTQLKGQAQQIFGTDDTTILAQQLDNCNIELQQAEEELTKLNAGMV